MFYFVVVLLVALDQITKVLAQHMLYEVTTFPVIPNVLHFTYVENRGIAFGLFQNMNYIFLPLSILITIGCFYFLNRAWKKRKWFISWGIALIASGAIGNILDKVFRGFVVDFIQVKLIDFPVFNIADILVSVGTVMVAIAILFLENGEKNENQL